MSIKFYNAKQENFEFSNFYMFDIKIDEVTYASVEHYFQSQKFHSEEYRCYIVQCSTPAKAYYLARQKIRGGYYNNYYLSKTDKTKLNDIIRKYKDAVKIREDWNTIKDCVMRKGVYSKFTQSDILKKKLLETGDRIILENSPRDNYWGIGRDEKGENMLGRILMEIRSILRKDFGIAPTLKSNWVIPDILLASAYPSSLKKEEREEIVNNLMKEGIDVILSLVEEKQEKKLYSYRKILAPNFIEPSKNFFITTTTTTPSKKWGRDREIVFGRYSIPDRKVVSDECVTEIVDTLMKYVGEKKKILVHCLGGKGRTGVILGVLMGRLYNISYQNAIKILEASFATRIDKGIRCKKMPQTRVQFQQIKRLLD